MLERPSRSTDHLIYDFAANLWTLKYLRLTNQFDWDTAKKAFDGMNTQYAAIMHRYAPLTPVENEMRGGLRISSINQFPSVWYGYGFEIISFTVDTFIGLTAAREAPDSGHHLRSGMFEHDDEL